MKLLLIILIFLVCVSIGYFLSRKYSSRKKFFAELVMLLEKLDTDINFSKQKLAEIFKGFNANSKELATLKQNFLNYLSSNEQLAKDKLFEGITLLKDEERETIFRFFEELGKLDVYNQTKQLSASKERFQSFCNTACEEAKKFCPLYIKLGIVVGLLVAVLLI